jgi:quinol monooxygenase YgiN
MGAQPGARRFQLLRSTADPLVFVEVAEWESAEHHRSAISTDTFRERVRDLPKVARVERGRYEVLRLDEERTAPVSA